ncbi:MAG: addiction module toxin RelE [Rhizobacter sp.]
MTRPLRLELAGALYHVTSRGDRREPIYLMEQDREDWLAVLAQVCERFNWVVHAYCQMTNHYHLLVETVDGNLARGMRQLNGEYTQRFNRRHGVVGHLFQGRYKAILVQKEAYLLELSRYVVLNPLRAGMVESLVDWPWSSYACMMGQQVCPAWLDSDWLLSQFGKNRTQAQQNYVAFVLEGRGVPSPLSRVQHQLLLGDEAFVNQHQPPAHQALNPSLRELSMAHRRAVAWPLARYEADCADRNLAMARAYQSGAYTMPQIAAHFGVHTMTVSRAVKKVSAIAVTSTSD